MEVLTAQMQTEYLRAGVQGTNLLSWQVFSRNAEAVVHESCR
jgi:hypothetical protein